MEKICLITFSNNADHQNVIYSMYNALQGKADVYTIGCKNPKSCIAPETEQNLYFDCPERPGIELKTFRIDIVRRIAEFIIQNDIKYLYFESLHVWNIILMCMCPRCIKVEAVHDVIPHDMSRTVMLCTKIACKLADFVILRNEKYKQLLSEKYNIPLTKIGCIAPWRHFPEEDDITHSGKFLSFGRIRKYKGCDKLEEIIRATPTVSYMIVGSPDEESRSLVNVLKTYSNVEMVDREVTDQEMTDFFHMADWVVLTYTSATQSGVIVDAYRLSRPVIAFNVGAISEQIEDGVTGFLIEEGNMGKFITAVKKASEMSAEEVSQLAHNAYKIGYKKYAAESASDKFVGILSSINRVKLQK